MTPLGYHVLSLAAFVASKTVGLWRRSGSVLILPTTDPGSLGDDAMLTACIGRLVSQKTRHIGILSYGPAIMWNFGEQKDGTRFDYYPLGKRRHRLRFIQAAALYERFYLLGADVLDGHYSEDRSVYRLQLTELARKAGAKAAIIGFSFNEHPTPGSVREFQRLSEDIGLCVRDAQSKARLEKVIHRDVRAAADLAFLLEPDFESPAVTLLRKWVEDKRQNGFLLVGINANGLFHKNCDLCSIYAQAITRFAEVNPRTAFLFISHDRRKAPGAESDATVSRHIFCRLPAEIQANSIVVEDSLGAREVKAISSFLDVVLTGRMHLAIAALGSGTPTAIVSYQGKVEGMLNLFELTNVALGVENIARPEALFELLNSTVQRRVELASKIKDRVPIVREKAVQNLNG